MKIVKLNTTKQTFFVPGFGHREIKNLQEFKNDDAFVNALKSYFPHVVFETVQKDKEDKSELLVEEPIQALEVETVEEVKEVKEDTKKSRTKK